MPANKCIVLGLTGGIACGKSEAAKYLQSLGAAHIDADEISRGLTRAGGRALDSIRARFGDDVISRDGALDRRAMGDIVFRDEASRRALEEIIHPMVWQETRAGLAAARSAGKVCAVLNVPLLFESGMDALCDVIWTVEAPEEVQIHRVMERGFTREQALERVHSQLPREERIARADRAIWTNRPIEDTRRELLLAYGALTACSETGA